MTDSNNTPANNGEPAGTNRDEAPPQPAPALDAPSQPMRNPPSDKPINRDPLIGQYLTEDYIVLDRLGAGGMAIVYKARHLKTDRIVAVKTLRERDPAIMERFYREVQTLAKLKHKNIVEALDCIRTDAHHTFLVMEYVEGITLETLLRTQGRVEKAEDIASLLSQICDALDHAHQLRIIHRDLKPANIVMLVDEASEITAKVLDFGIAKLQDDLQKLTSEGQALGSPLYMSPEQCMGHEVTPASDVYSLGILSYELITGGLPYKSTKMLEIMSAHCSPDIWPQPIEEIRADLPNVAQLNQIIFKAINTRLEDRFQTVAEFGKAILFWIQSVKSGKNEPAPRVQMAPIVTARREQEKTRAIQEAAAARRNKAGAKPTAKKFELSERNIALLKLCSFLVVATLLTSGLAMVLINIRGGGGIDTSKFMEASRFVSNLLSPPKKEPEPVAEPVAEPLEPAVISPTTEPQQAPPMVPETQEAPRILVPEGR
ncbi:MAG: serine/threonine-protein kinase [Candidatus Melainabacteria bacterium]|nr:serine/threonine-protein kinase [Candidatus Melainabacteria bacterium]